MLFILIFVAAAAADDAIPAPAALAPPPVPSLSMSDAVRLMKDKRTEAAGLGGVGLAAAATVKSKLYPDRQVRLQVLTTMCSASLQTGAEDLGLPRLEGIDYWMVGNGCRLGSCSIGCTGMALPAE